MDTVKFAPSHLSPEEVVVACKANEDGMTLNSGLFPSPPFASSVQAGKRVILSGIISLETSLINQLKTCRELKATTGHDLGQDVLQNAGYVDGICIANPASGAEIAAKGGFDSKKDAVHTEAVPPASTHFSVAIGVHLTEADLHCDAIHGFGKITYKYYYSYNVTTFAWVLGDAGTNSMTLTGLTVDVPIAFKVVGSNDNGAGKDSAIIIKTLPKA